jgi:hypothetical protein
VLGTAALLLLGAGGCGLLGGSVSGSVVDAHVVTRIVPGCPTMLARTLDHGYTLLQPLDPERGAPLAPAAFEVTGLFEGPVRAGESVFRYVAPAVSDTWRGEPQSVLLLVHAVRLDLPTASAQLAARCPGAT